MPNPIIKVHNLSKQYRLGLKEQQGDTLVGKFKNFLTAPYRNYKRLRQLSKFRQEDESIFWALKDINFEVQQGEVLGIIGKNGAGKSTLLKILSQITEPTSGRIEIHGRVASLLEVGTGFHPELSGRENIYMNGTILGMTRREIDSKLDEIIDFSGVEKFIDTPVKFYSSGMKVRLGFSVAAHLEPEILIIDEVLAVGDYEFQQKCLGKMEDVSKNQGRTVLFVSHNMEAIKNLCQDSVLLENGKLVFRAKTGEVIDEYYSNDRANISIDSIGFTGVLSKKLLFEEVSINGKNPFSNTISIDNSETCEIQIKGRSLEELKVLITLAIYKDGVRIGSKFDCDDFTILKDDFVSTFKITSNFFKSGNYRFGLGAQSLNGEWMWTNDGFSITVNDRQRFNIDQFATGIVNIASIVTSNRKQ